ncbi:alpha-N-acetylglucosaminidase [Flavisolibacter nicotianae]|uniref:alpha-N-acetylglucosaminidase n=1 Tax=Flavisolibacter nicotianae TaxID=2364882 RepID=UPI000EADA6E4|nr:alpha-N-acetylglucosaminidase [Flavisolibacter nicotianae]
MLQRTIRLFFVLLFCSSFSTAFCNGGDEKSRAVLALIRRVVPGHANQFQIGFMEKKNGKDCFAIESIGNKIVLHGSNGVSIASALHYYLKHLTHCSITWNGTNLHLPKKLPAVPKKIEKETPYRYRYYLNYCTFNYTMSWWNWDRWQKEIDWMALNGINMPLAITGQNAIWKEVYNGLGFTDKELESFFSGPAYFNWFWMGNLDAWGGPLPQSWMESHKALQKQILERERSLGMTPILPAFTGHVPPAFKEKFPAVKLKKTDWAGFSPVSLLDPSEPMFLEIGKRFIEAETKAYGTDHLYTADTFNENKPPTNDSTFLNDVSKKVYQSMAAADPQATWIMQGWMFHFQSKFWQPTQIRALLNAVPNEKMIILDLWSEKNPVWNRTEAYYGKPWIWCMLHNFGGNVNLYGRMEQVANGPAETLHDPAAGKLTGIGLTPEGIQQNPVMYDLMLENVWRQTPVDLAAWLNDYTRRRYGRKDSRAEEAWGILRRTAYADSVTNGGPESIITGRPTFGKNTGGTTTTLSYDPQELVKAWTLLVAAADDLKTSDGFRFDLVDLTRQVLANYASVIQQQFAADYQRKDPVAFARNSQRFLTLIADLDALLATRKDFLLGNWLEDAKRWGTTVGEKKLYERNARNLITLWGDKNNKLHEYACKQWAGLLNGFYKKRWEQFFSQVTADLQNGRETDFKKLESQLKDREWDWVNGRETYPVEPNGDAVQQPITLYRKYVGEIRAAKPL